MANPQHTHDRRDPQDTSVVFHLRDLMRIEAERVAAEEAETRQAAARAALARTERDREAKRAAEQRECEEQALERQAREAETAQAQQHQATLLRIRAESEARERADMQRLALEHERSLRGLQLEASRSRVTRVLGAVVALFVTGCGFYYAWVLAPSLEAARIDARAARETLVKQRDEAEALRTALSRLAAERSSVRPAPQPPTATPESVVPKTTKNTPAAHATHAVKAPRVHDAQSSAIQSIADLDMVDGDDPLYGMPGIDAAQGKRKAPR